MRKTPYPHQNEAFKAIIKSLIAKEVPYVNMSTGSGKALTTAMLAKKCLLQGGRTLILVPSSELATQNYREVFDYIDEKQELGICSAKLGKAQINRKIVVATYTSFLRRRSTSGFFNLVIIDECQYVSALPDSSYQKIIKSLRRINPDLNLCGLTATPYRNVGVLHENTIDGPRTFTECCYETSIPDLIKSGHLSNITSISGDIQIDLDGVKMSGSDYSTEEVGVKFSAICSNAVQDMKVKFEHYDIKTALVFASTIKNAEEILKEWNDSSTMRIVHGGLTNSERNSAINWLKSGDGQRIIVNVQILTVGFDHAALDCVCMMRSTKSTGLYIQCVGRVLRAHKEKEMSYFLDYGKNLLNHGPIDAIIPPKTKKKPGDQPRKICSLCNEINILSAKKCKKCDAEFVSLNEEGNYLMRTKADILQAKIDLETFSYSVDKVYYEKSYSRKDQTEMIKVRFYDEDINHIHDSYLTLNHRGFARDNAIKMLISMLKNPSDYSDIAQFEGGVNVDNVLLLLDNDDYREQYFKKIKSITLAPQISGKFKELKSIGYT